MGIPLTVADFEISRALVISYSCYYIKAVPTATKGPQHVALREDQSRILSE